MLKLELLIIGYLIWLTINWKCTANPIEKDKVISIIDRNEFFSLMRLS